MEQQVLSETPSHRRTCAFLIDYYGGDYQLGLIQGAEEASQRYDNHLVVPVGRWLKAPQTIEATQNTIYSHVGKPGTDAVAIAAGCISHFVTVDELKAFFAGFAPLPVVSVSVELPGIPSLVVDNVQGQYAAVQHLIAKHACRRIAYIRGPETSFEATERLEGYKKALLEFGIDFDPALVETGTFWVDSGKECVDRFLERQVQFDALVAANDYMALGAMERLKLRGYRIPHDVRIAGFDDVPASRMASPSLTTVRQPLQRMGARAVQLLEEQMDGQRVAERHVFEIDLVPRQSCGCGFIVERRHSMGHRGDAAPVNASRLNLQRERLQSVTLAAVFVQPEQWPVRIDGLLDALEAELSGERGRFLEVLGEQLESARSRTDALDQYYNVIGALRQELRYQQFEDCSSTWQEDLWHSALVLVGEWIGRAHMRTVFDQERSNDTLRASVERLSTTLTHMALSEALTSIIPTTSIASACLGLKSTADLDKLRVFAATGETARADALSSVFGPQELAPSWFFRGDKRGSYVLMPLTHSDTYYGHALFEAGEQCSIYSMLREQIGAALKAADMHRVVVEATSRRERADRERLERETEIAQQIQTAILPEELNVAGLEIAALMRPATSVGGDYYDVIPTDTGCYLAIGDVTGHGLLSGMIMLMVQSMIAATIRANPDKKPSELLPTINRALYDNVHHRLHETDHVTLTLIRYETDGRLVISGAHEDLIIWRKRTHKCERLAPPGFWLAAIDDVSAISEDVVLQLEDGDLVFLYTDGVTEAMNASHEQFGLKRLQALVERCGTEQPASICETVLQSVQTWSSAQIDDISMLAVRYGQDSRN
jgi:DNA-binding LacI/PurR family transcriptional regulator/serine phosphatase RsbU (regulator of sigma subunit)